jgi:thiol-disulfide isomerase/thioredoxin
MKKLSLYLLQSLLLTAVIHAAEPDATHKAIRVVIDEYENKVRANTMKIIEAKTEEEKNQYRATVPSAEPYAKQVMEVVQKNLEATGSAHGVNWLATQATNFPEGQSALKMLGTSHTKAEGIALAVKGLEYHPLEFAEPILKAVREQNPNESEKAAATYALGMQYFRRYEAATDAKAAEEAKDKALEYFQEVSSKYAKTLIEGFPIADQAARTMFELANLSVGSECPEIEGADVEGAAFKLSDFRDKHVMIIFWGGWCHACHGVIPLINEMVTKYQGRPVVFLGVNTDVPDEARKAFQDYKVNFRNWSDGTTSGPITSIFNLRNFPTLYLLDGKGKIVLKNTSLEAIKAKLDTL